jgi:hypothetical protein
VAVSVNKKGPKIPKYGIPAKVAKDCNTFTIFKVKGKRISRQNVDFLIKNKIDEKTNKLKDQESWRRVRGIEGRKESSVNSKSSVNADDEAHQESPFT